MVFQGADSLLAGTAIDGQLQVDRLRVKRLAPGDVRGTEKRQRRHIERGGEVPRSGIGRDQQARVTNRRLRQTDAERFVRQADDLRMRNLGNDALRGRAFARAADDQDRSAKFVRQPASQFDEVFRRPILGRAEGTTRVECDVIGGISSRMSFPKV